MFDLKSAIDAANVTLMELATMTGIHYTTLSRATNGLHLSDDQTKRVKQALRVALRKAENAAARERAKLSPSKRVSAESASEQIPAA